MMENSLGLCRMVVAVTEIGEGRGLVTTATVSFHVEIATLPKSMVCAASSIGQKRNSSAGRPERPSGNRVMFSPSDVRNDKNYRYFR
jgi:hypothetical protein